MRTNYFATGALALGVLLFGAGTPQQATSTCKSTYEQCSKDAMYKEAQRIIDEQTNALRASNECVKWDWNHPKKGSRFIVKGDKYNRSVVWMMSVQDAFDANKDADRWNDVVALYVCK